MNNFDPVSYLPVLGIEPRSLGLLSKHFTADLFSFCFDIAPTKLSKLALNELFGQSG